MKVIECVDYKPEFPELFNWSMIESIKLENVANDIKNNIEHDLRLPADKRYRVGGLRSALNIIAKYADI